MKINSFKGLQAFITGGSSGIGLAIARSLVLRGASIVIFSRNYENLHKAADNIAKMSISDNQSISYRQLDVSDRLMCERVLPAAAIEFGPPDILINSAGVSFPQKFETIPQEKFNEIVKTNLYGIWNTTDILLPHLRLKKGYIVNVSSIAGLIGVFGMTAYSASKYAVIGYTEALRSELKFSNVTVSVLCPADVRTPMLEKANRIKPAESKALSKAATIMEPDEVAESLIKAMAKGQFLIIPNASGKYVNIVKRWLPTITERIIDRKIRCAKNS